jgi:hypothetical protein
MPLRSSAEDVVQDLQHVVVVAHLAAAGRVLVIWWLSWHLLPHLREVHVDSRVTLNQIFPLLQDRDQLLVAGVINMVNDFAQPCPMHSVVGWEPGTMPSSRYQRQRRVRGQSGRWMVAAMRAASCFKSGGAHLKTWYCSGM